MNLHMQTFYEISNTYEWRKDHLLLGCEIKMIKSKKFIHDYNIQRYRDSYRHKELDKFTQRKIVGKET